MKIPEKVSWDIFNAFQTHIKQIFGDHNDWIKNGLNLIIKMAKVQNPLFDFWQSLIELGFYKKRWILGVYLEVLFGLASFAKSTQSHKLFEEYWAFTCNLSSNKMGAKQVLFKSQELLKFASMWIDEEKWRQQQVTKFKLINDPLPHTCLYTDQPILKTKIELSCQAKILEFSTFFCKILTSYRKKLCPSNLKSEECWTFYE